MSAPASRRGFLRGLVSLPLIGGGVTLIGAPTAVAEPISQQLLHEYHDWLMFERSSLIREAFGSADRFGPGSCFGAALKWHRARGEFRTTSEGEPLGDGVSFPSTRAALVLSAVGCDWQRGGL